MKMYYDRTEAFHEAMVEEKITEPELRDIPDRPYLIYREDFGPIIGAPLGTRESEVESQTARVADEVRVVLETAGACRVVVVENAAYFDVEGQKMSRTVTKVGFENILPKVDNPSIVGETVEISVMIRDDLPVTLSISDFSDIKETDASSS